VHDSTKRLRGEQFYTDASWPIPLDAATSVGAGGGCNDQNPARPSSVFLLGRVRHGDRARGSEPAHLRGPGGSAARADATEAESKSPLTAMVILSVSPDRETNEY
jgi:hypothetical protein